MSPQSNDLNNRYVQPLIESVPVEIQNPQHNPEDLYVISEGGAFNGSYVLGVFYFLKELENRKLVNVKRISACSVSTFVGLLYFCNRLELFEEIYVEVIEIFKQTCNLDIFDVIYKRIEAEIGTSLYKLVNKKLYVSYYNLETRRKVVRREYKNNHDLFCAIKRSAFIFMLLIKECY